MTVGICPACGYPKLGTGLCFFCLPAAAGGGAQTFDLSAPAVSSFGATPKEVAR